MNEREAREIRKHENSYNDEIYIGEARGYLEAIEKAKVLEEAFLKFNVLMRKNAIDLHPSFTGNLDFMEDALSQWEKEK